MWRKIEIFKIAAFLACLLTASQPGVCLADNLLCDSGFELSEPNGGFPDSGCWSMYPSGQARCTSLAARSGANGLWQCSDFAVDQWQSQVFQDLSAAPGRRYFAGAWVRTEFPASQWVDGSKAFVKLLFLDADKNPLAQYTSRPVTDPNTDWSLLSFATYSAPAHTHFVRFALCVEKPQSVGQTILNFDDCILREIEPADSIRLDEIPSCGSADLLRGSVVGVNPDDYKVGVYIFVKDWWPKPTFASPWTDIASDGSWQCDISKTPSDLQATEVIAFLVPKNEIPDWPVNFNDPVGLSALPGEAFRFPSVGSFRPSCFSKVHFAGYDWLVKDSGDSNVGPGPNFFKSDNAWVDANGFLHLKITNDQGRWSCAEVFTEDSLGGGTYKFEVQNNIALLDPNAILGLFTWDEFAPQYSGREIDIELGRWGDPSADNAQFVIQPWNKTGNLHRFDFGASDANSLIGVFDWGFNRVAFGGFFGHIASPADNVLVNSWIYEANDAPQPGSENARINLWLKDGRPPYYGSEVEMVVKDFEVNSCFYDVAPLSLDFNSVLISKTAAKAVTITNTRQCLPYIVSLEIDGLDADYFSVPDRAFSLEPGSSRQIDVSFSPDVNRLFQAELRISSSAGLVTVPLSGRGGHIGYTRLPAVGSPEFLEGAVSGLRFPDYRVVSYLFVWDRWYIKPLCLSKNPVKNPLVRISSKGAWHCNVDVELTDKAATQVASFLVPRTADYPPCVLYSLDDVQMGRFEHITADRPKLSISSVKAKAGNDAADDSITIDGWYYITMDEILSADRLCVNILHDGQLVWSLCVPFDADRFLSRGWYLYDTNWTYLKLKNTDELLNSYAGKFRFVLNRAELTCLGSPITLTVALGGFNGSAVADEDLDAGVINGIQPVPIQFLSGCTDSVRIDKLTLRNGARDSVYIKGAIVFKNKPPDLTAEDFSVGWGLDNFTVPAGNFKRIGKSLKYRCVKARANEGGLVDAILDFKSHSFQLKITDTNLDTKSDTVNFNLVIGDFSKGLSVKTAR